MNQLWNNIKTFFVFLWEKIVAIVFAIGRGFKAFGLAVAAKTVEIALLVAGKCRDFGIGVAHFVIGFPRGFVNFFVALGLGIAHFFRDLPKAFCSKDSFVNLLVGMGAVIVWCVPIFVVVYVLVWFLAK